MAEGSADFKNTDDYTTTNVINGIKYPPHVKRENLEALAKFDLRDDDIVIVAFPKSGTNWVLEIVTKTLVTSGKIGASSSDDILDKGKLEFQYSHELRPRHVILQECASPRVISTHLNLDSVPPGISNPQNKVKIIVVMRNPKDTVVSYYHFGQKCRSLDGRKPLPPWDEYFRIFLEGKNTYGCYFDHVLGWWQRRDDPHFLFLKYEDMKKDLPNAVRTVAAFLQVNLDDASIETIAHACTFANMKGILDNSRIYDRTVNARKGLVGDWKTMFTDEQNKLFDQKCKTKLEGSGLHFDFE
ncbi:sulfotransferase 6B1-like [Branchiostoma lanceolatum]|uniref:sulfotransferase 6B1-like n=1 Tax=Branchiostoma lanceolatum TaxID=7740 RepID=UPI001132B6F1